MSRRRRRALSVLLVGPDGTGKSTVAGSLADSESLAPVTTTHYRPGILWKRSPEVTVTPHAEARRSSAASTIKLLAVFVDFVLGHVGPWRRLGREGLIVLERGWWDHVADPVRYRLPPQLSGIVRVLGRLLPRADLVVILGGDPSAIVDRKPELSEHEVAAQLERWRRLADRAGRRVLELDTVVDRPEVTVARIERALSVRRRRWMAVPGTPGRNAVVATIGEAGSAALAVYRPNSRAARIVAPLSRLSVQLGLGRRVTDPVGCADALVEMAGLDPSVGMAAMASPGRSRVVVGLAGPTELLAVAKVGCLDDAGLRQEAAMLGELQAAPTQLPQLRTPMLRFAGEVEGHFVVMTDAVVHIGAPVGRSEIGPVLGALAEVGRDGLTHGDLAPWNLVRSADGHIVVLDFEHATWGVDPGFDLCHFLVQSGALLDAVTAEDVVAELSREFDGAGPSAEEIIRHYCDVRRARHDAGAAEQRFMVELEASMTDTS